MPFLALPCPAVPFRSMRGRVARLSAAGAALLLFERLDPQQDDDFTVTHDQRASEPVFPRPGDFFRSEDGSHDAIDAAIGHRITALPCPADIENRDFHCFQSFRGGPRR